jgi:hypothetical protein
MTKQEERCLFREAFREGVFARDGHKCVNCGRGDIKLDAHHIIERRLFPDGGYYLSNGATLCDPDCHMLAEQTVLACEEIREKAGITNVIIPPHLYRDERYDKWGNPYLPNGTRIRGELFDDESVQKILAPVLSEFTRYVKYPRTYHVDWSPGVGKDDRIQPTPFLEGTHVIVTEKMDGENTTFYNDYLHARSIDYKPHPSRDRVKAIWASVAHDIPEGWRVCGENLYAKHSIEYTDLTGYFQVFSVWNDKNVCLSWSETVEWAAMLGLPMVPVLYAGPLDTVELRKLAEGVVARGGEGIVIREVVEFHYSEFRFAVGKYVRQNHVQTHGGWMRNTVTPNKLREV